MRNLLLACGLVFTTVTLFGCGDEGASGPRLRGGVPAPGDMQEHDDGDLDGDGIPDQGNPNADAKPAAPGSAGQAGSQFAVKVMNATPTVDLGEKVDIDVTVEPVAGFTGPVSLSVTGLPAGATAAPLNLTVGATPATGKLSITAAATAVPSAPGASAPLVVTATGGNSTSTANANFKINPRLKLTVPMNIDALRQAGAGTVYRDEWGTNFGTAPQPLRTQTGNGIVVVVFNADSKVHTIHGANGFAHGSEGVQPNAFEMANGAQRLRTLNPGANANGYMHDGADGPSTSFRISVQAVN